MNILERFLNCLTDLVKFKTTFLHFNCLTSDLKAISAIFPISIIFLNGSSIFLIVTNHQ